MNEKKYVQYKNDPNGTKWELAVGSYNESLVATNWRVCAGDDFHYLPKSEYAVCAPPERWVDVTAECEYHQPPHEFEGLTHNKCKVYVSGGYRFKKLNIGQFSENKWAFIVEKRED